MRPPSPFLVIFALLLYLKECLGLLLLPPPLLSTHLNEISLGSQPFSIAPHNNAWAFFSNPTSQSSQFLLASSEMISDQDKRHNLPPSGTEQLQESQEKELVNSKNRKKGAFHSDTVVRVVDANTIKLKLGGLASLAGVQTPLTGGFPECTSTYPSRQLQKLLPKGSLIQVRYLSSDESNLKVPRVLIAFTSSNSNARLINAELIRSGYAKPVARGREAAEAVLPGFTQGLSELNQRAKDKQAGLYQICESDGTPISPKKKIVAADNDQATANKTAKIDLQEQFEPLDYTTQTQWGIDGGKTIRVAKETTKTVPTNPGDKVGCSDFDVYEDALKYYETYHPYYGDVARLDRDEDGVPCPKLPHTKNMNQFRRKVPMASRGYGQ